MLAFLNRRIAGALMLCVLGAGCASTTPTSDAALLSKVRALIPQQLPGGLTLIAVRPMAPRAPTWRMVEVPQPGGGKIELPVSMAYALSPLYAYPGESHYANVKVDASEPGRFAQDRENVLMAARAIFEMHRQRDPARLQDGFPPVEAGQGRRHGLEYYYVFNNSLHGTGLLHIFVPEQEVIITAYLLGRKRLPDSSIDTTRATQRSFLFGYIDAIASAR